MNDDEDIGEGVVVATFDEPDRAVGAADEHGASPDGWVNQGMAADDYCAAKQRR